MTQQVRAFITNHLHLEMSGTFFSIAAEHGNLERNQGLEHGHTALFGWNVGRPHYYFLYLGLDLHSVVCSQYLVALSLTQRK